MIALPECVSLPWFLRPLNRRGLRELWWMRNPWEGPVWFNAWEGRPFVCPWDHATLRIEVYAVYDMSGYPEPAYAGWCPLCESEFEL